MKLDIHFPLFVGILGKKTYNPKKVLKIEKSILPP